ncbi:MAG: hypothetical protein ACOCQD_00125 [archaeon]
MVFDYDGYRLPDDFPYEGNEKTAEKVSKVSSYLVHTEKVATCVIVNCLTINIRQPNDKTAGYNSNFIVMEKGYGKTSMLDILYKSNSDYMVVTPQKHFESSMYERHPEDFIGKTWLNYDAISCFTTSKQQQRDQLVAFYTETLSDGHYERDKVGSISTDYNLMYGMAMDRFNEFQKDLHDSTIFDRIVPIYMFFNEEQKEEISLSAERNIRKSGQHKMPQVKLPYREKVGEVKNKLHFNYEDDEIANEIRKLSKEISNMSGLARTRANKYVSNFIFANAYLNGRMDYNKTVIVPSMADVRLFEYIKDIHLPFDKRTLDYHVYCAILNFCDYNDCSSINLATIFQADELEEFYKNKKLSKEIIKNDITTSVDNLINRGLITKVQNLGQKDAIFKLKRRA